MTKDSEVPRPRIGDPGEKEYWEKECPVVEDRTYGDVPTVEEIEQFVIDAGSDNLPTFGGRYEGGCHVQQIPDEIAPCIHAILEAGRKIEAYLEVGVAAAGTTFLFNHFFRPGKIVLVDDGNHWKAGLRNEILKDIPHTFIRGNSHSPEVVGQVAEASPDFDIIIIDAGHEYSAVRADAESYFPMLRAGGFLVLHDSALPEWGVMRVVAELKEDARVALVGEYVTKTSTRACGVALFRRATLQQGGLAAPSHFREGNK
jgi:methyltransferase family protein